MKWLAPFLCLWATTAALAQNNPEELIIELPLMMTCSTASPENQLKQEYGEIPFLNGRGRFIIPNGSVIEGELQIYLDPGKDRSYTVIMFVNDLNCMILSGEQIQPSLNRDGPI